MSNPEAAYEGVIEDRIRNLRKALDAVGKVVALRNVTKVKLERVTSTLVDLERKIAAAVKLNDQLSGRELLDNKRRLETEKAELERNFAVFNKQVEDNKLRLEKAHADLEALKQERATNVARLKIAAMRREAADALSGLSLDGGEEVLAGLRESIEEKVGQADVREELDTSANREIRLAQVEKVADAAATDDEFARLRANYEAQQGTHATATPTGAGGGGGKDA